MDSLKSVLVPTDFSPAAWQAVLMGIRLSLLSKAALHLIHINPQPDEEYQLEVQERLSNISENLASIYNVTVDSRVLSGEPTKVIDHFVKSEGIDLVIMGMNGTSSNEIGSLTSEILKKLKCPVLVMPSGD